MLRSCLLRLLAVPLLALLLLGVYEAVVVYRAKARTPAILARLAQREVRLADLPAQRRAWLLAVEDPGFYGHRGIDFSTPGAGWTTISQALVKRLYFDRFTPGFAKIEQSLIAWAVFDPAVPKDEQLELFLNQASFGSPDGREIIGFGAAARAYFGRPLGALGDAEFLSLVAMLIAPNALNPREHPIDNVERVRRIQALVAGRCRPTGLLDTRYEACPGS